MDRHVCVAGVVCALLAWDAALQAEVIDSGYVENTGDEPAVIFSTTIEAADAVWLRLNFNEVLLSGDEGAGTGSYFLITSVLDGAFQTMHASHVEQWGNTSAYFNGDTVTFELIAHPGTGQNRVVIGEPTAGPASEEMVLEMSYAACTDRRALSADPRVGRTLTASGAPACTAFIIDDPTHNLLTAGHCYNALLYTVEFNVPLSDPLGNAVHPPPEDQYAVDRDSRQWQNGVQVGHDWCYFGCFPNSTSGLTPFEAQGQFYSLACSVPSASGQTVRVTGFGTAEESGRKTWNRAQTTHTGDYHENNTEYTRIGFRVDLSNGNSGSPVALVDTCEVIGIATDKACHVITGVVYADGTAIDNPLLQEALAEPKGVCEPDCNDNDIPDRCDIDCGEPGGPCDVTSCGLSQDCSSNGIPDECEDDCNGNGIADGCDITAGTSQDCTSNGMPDECEWDCNINGVADSCDILAGTSQDCNTNGMPDECDMSLGMSEDCNTNAIPDECDIAAGSSEDCQENGIPDECESWMDCNTNTVPDDCDIAGGTSQDCNSNDIPDECDLAGFGDLFVARSTLYPKGRVDQLDSASVIYVKDFVLLDGGGLLQPLAAAFHPNGRLLIGDEDATLHTIRQYDGVTGDYIGDLVAAGAGGLYSPWDITFGPDGNLYVANVCTNGASTNGILEYDGDTGASLGTFASEELEAPYGLTFGPSGNLFVCDYETAEVVEFDGGTGSLVGVFASSNGADLDGPCALAFHPVSGNLFVADAATNGIIEFNGTTGALVGAFIEDVGGYGAASLMDLKFGPDGHLYVSHKELRAVYKYDESTAELLGTLPYTGHGAGKPFRMAFRPPLADCNTNGVPDACDVDAGTSTDCNGNASPDECDLMDCDTNGCVDLFDFAGFQCCLASTNGTCLAAFDRAADCGTIDLADYAVFASQLADSSIGGESMMMGGGGGEGGGGGAAAAPEGDGDEGAGEDAADEAPPSPEEEYDPWTCVEAAVSLEVRPVGSDTALTVLAPDTTYELHYQVGYDRVNAYVLFAVATSPGHGFAGASAPPAGDWSATGDFGFVDIEAEFDGLPTPHDYPEGYFRYQMAYDDFWPGTEKYAGPQGHLCNFTTQSAGELNLELYMCWLDNEAYEYAEMYAQVVYIVAASDDGEADDPPQEE